MFQDLSLFSTLTFSLKEPLFSLPLTSIRYRDLPSSTRWREHLPTSSFYVGSSPSVVQSRNVLQRYGAHTIPHNICVCVRVRRRNCVNEANTFPQFISF